MPVCAAQHAGSGLSVSRAVNRAGLAACLLLVGSVGVRHAEAVGDTRTITLHHVHTDEDLTITYKKNGQYDEEALKKINWIMRDWRKNEAIRWTGRRSICSGRSTRRSAPRNRSTSSAATARPPPTRCFAAAAKSGVARNSQHTLGKAIDFYIPGVPLEKLRATAMRLQGGGVGYYPTSGSPFVHLDVGNVRAWPRMTREQLVKLFPDGRTVHLPADGTPLPGYELAQADLERGTPHRRRPAEAQLPGLAVWPRQGRRRGRRQRLGSRDRRRVAQRERRQSPNPRSLNPTSPPRPPASKWPPPPSRS